MSGSNYLNKLLNGLTVEWSALGDERFVEVENAARMPVKASLRVSGEVPYYGANNIQDYVDGYTHDGEYVLIAEDGSASLDNYSIQYATGRFWANNHVHVVRGKHGLNTKFLYHYLRAADFTPYLPNKDRAKLTKGEMVKVPFPIPCPDNPEKSLEIQAEIVRILDAFTELTTELAAELTTELTARKKQYEHYRDRLFSFKEVEVEWIPLANLIQTITAPAKLKSDAYRQIGSIPIIDQGIQYIAGYANEDVASIPAGEYIIFGDHSEHIKYVNFAFVQGADGIKILKSKAANAKYIYYAFECLYKKELSYKRHWSTAQETLIPIPFSSDPERSLAEQNRIVKVLDRFHAITMSLTEGLPREIELRKKQYAHYRDLLLSFPKPECAGA